MQVFPFLGAPLLLLGLAALTTEVIDGGLDVIEVVTLLLELLTDCCMPGRGGERERDKGMSQGLSSIFILAPLEATSSY